MEAHRIGYSARFSLIVGGLCLALLGCQEEAATVPSGPTPVILIDIDTLRADHLGTYGYARPTSPEVDRFSSESVRFEWAFSQAPNTPPSQASILTSLYPSTHGRIRDEQVLPAGVTTLAEHFQRAGYKTAAFVDGGLMASEFGLDQGFEIYDDEAGGLAEIDGKVKSWIDQNQDERIDDDALIVKTIMVDQAPVIKRFRPVSRGRAHPILKRSSHLTVVVGTPDTEEA